MTIEPRIQQALKWWSYRQSIKLFREAENIRDGLLQESFSIRRSLDLLALDHLNLSSDTAQQVLKKIDNFHYSLVQLSDRLFPASLEHSLPLAIECLLNPWIADNPHLTFNIHMPVHWRHEPIEHGLIILKTLEELLIITLSGVLTPLSVNISLKIRQNLGQLIVKINYPDLPTLIFYSSLPQLEYLYESFQFLISGRCFHRTKNLSICWYFCW